MSWSRWNLMLLQALLGVVVAGTVSGAALADSTTLICDVPSLPGSCCIIDGPGSIDLNEAAGSITLRSPPWHTNNQRYPEGVSTYAAKFDPNTITFRPGNETVTINRLTGIMVNNGVTWTCHIGKPQF